MVASSEVGFSAVAILGGGWLQSPVTTTAHRELRTYPATDLGRSADNNLIQISDFGAPGNAVVILN